MGWQRKHFEKHRNKKAYVNYLKEQGRDGEIPHMISPNSDNRHYCWGCDKEKYCYLTEKKANLAKEYYPGKYRVYYCDLCCAYHITSKITIDGIWHINNGFVKIAIA